MDVRFHEPAEYGQLLAEGGRYIERPFQEIAITRRVQPPPVRPQGPPRAVETMSFSKLLGKYQAATKHALRGKSCEEDVEALDAELVRAIRGCISERVARLYIDTKELYYAA